MTEAAYHPVHGVYCATAHTVSTAFEQEYIAVRSKEARVYTDEVLAELPDISPQHALYQEWQVRKQSAARLVNYFHRSPCSSILEIGCGNGWLCNLLSRLEQTTVIGTDINLTELQQAARVFKRNNLFFVYDVFNDAFMPGRQFDAIVFAASIQYFPSLDDILAIALRKLTARGTVHILDTFFYRSATEQVAAAERTNAYYSELGFPDMSERYFHHSLQDLQPYPYQILYNPRALVNKLKKTHNPFPWIVIEKQKLNSTTNE